MISSCAPNSPRSACAVRDCKKTTGDESVWHFLQLKTTAAAAAQIEIRLKPDIYVDSAYNLKCSNLQTLFLELDNVNLCGSREEKSIHYET